MKLTFLITAIANMYRNDGFNGSASIETAGRDGLLLRRSKQHPSGGSRGLPCALALAADGAASPDPALRLAAYSQAIPSRTCSRAFPCNACAST